MAVLCPLRHLFAYGRMYFGVVMTNRLLGGLSPTPPAGGRDASPSGPLHTGYWWGDGDC